MYKTGSIEHTLRNDVSRHHLVRAFVLVVEEVVRVVVHLHRWFAHRRRLGHRLGCLLRRLVELTHVDLFIRGLLGRLRSLLLWSQSLLRRFNLMNRLLLLLAEKVKCILIAFAVEKIRGRVGRRLLLH